MVRSALICAFLMSSALPGFAQDKLSSIDIQLFVQNEIEKRLVNDTLSFIDFDQKRVVQTVPVEAHPMIFKGDGIYVACITVSSMNGDEYPVDIYLLDTEDGLFTTQVTFGQSPRDQLKSMMKAGFFTKYN